MATKKEEIKLTKYEKARIIGARAMQVSMGAKILIPMTDTDFEKLGYDPIAIAKKEFEAGVIPIDVVRPMPKKKIEKEEV